MANIALRNGGRRVNRRRRHHLGGPRIRRVMPTRPKKPASAFNLFIRHYFQTPMARNFHSTSESMRYAGQFWRANPNMHARYIEEASTARANFARDIARFRVQQQVAKRPGNAFIHFAADLWRTEGRASGRSIAEYGKFAGAAWKQLTPAAKQPFIDRANAAKAEHARMISDVGHGFTRLEDYAPGNRAASSAAASASSR